MFQNQEGLNRSTVCVLESQPELQRGDVRTGSCRLHHPGQQRPSHCGVWHSEGIGYGSLPSWSDLQALETRWGTGNKITRIHFKLQTDQKYTSVCSFFFFQKWNVYVFQTLSLSSVTLSLFPVVIHSAFADEPRSVLLCRLPLPHCGHWHPQGTARGWQQGDCHMVRTSQPCWLAGCHVLRISWFLGWFFPLLF